MKRFFRRSTPKPESSGQALGSSPTTPYSSTQALGPSIVADVANARVDLIFLHGLTGHRERTWTATGENDPWFKSLLPKDLPTARIITYGYDADVVNLTRVAGQNTVREHSTNLINDLAALRRDAAGRPIIFVAHSLGGLVCQDALLVCNNPNEEAQSDILSSTCGIAFLGTPHAGSDLETFATAVANIVSLVKTPNKKLLKVLGRNSEVLANIENGFLTMVQRRLGDRQSSLKPIALHAFVEEMPVDFLGRRVVEPESAKIRGYNFDTIHANHMEMTKFRTAADAGYLKVLNRLKSWIDDDEGLQYANRLRLKFETLWPGMELAKSEPPTSAKQLCKSPDIKLSLGWFLDSSEYRIWKSASSSNLWLHGEHGDGKTVVMSYVLSSLSRDKFQTDEQGIASIFCSCNDSEEGVVASLVLQLLQNKGSPSKLPIPTFRPGYERPDCNHLLWGLLKVLIMASPGIVLIIDGIDKLELPARTSFLDRFDKLETGGAGMGMHQLRVLISSGNSDHMRSAPSHCLSIDRERERRECLKTLEFQEWNAREIGIQNVDAAGKRIFYHPKYRSWVQCDQPSVLWLEGKPGSGKSTLVKFMVKALEKDTSLGQAKQRDLLQGRDPLLNSPRKGGWVFNNPSDKSAIISRFYYSFRGGNTQTSHELMLRSIVYQIWSDNSGLFSLIRDRYRKLSSRAAKDAHEYMLGRGAKVSSEHKPFWSYDDLKEVLESLHESDFNLSVFIIVDGMDESNNDQRGDILTLLLDLARPNPKSSCMVKVFIASRPENNINSRLQLVPHHVKLQDVNEEDIRVVVERWVKRMVSEGGCEEETLLEAKDYIMKHCDGVFMWVTLVLRDLERYINNGGYTKFSLNTRLRSLPKELGGKDGFYWAMINSLVENYKEDQEQQERGRRILAWVTFAERPILVTELRDALATPSKLQGTGFSTYVLDDNRPHRLDKAILSSCGGLAEVRDSPSGEIVQLIHQTAREFLLHEDKHAGPYHLEEIQGDIEIATACCRYLRIVFRPDFPPADANGELTKVEMMVHLNHLGSSDEKIRDEFMDFVELLNKWSNSYAHLLLGQWIEALEWPTNLHVDDASASLCLHVLLICAEDIRKEEVAQVLVSLRPDLLHIEAGKGDLVTTGPLHENTPHPISQIIEGVPIRSEYQHRDGLRVLLDLEVDADLKDTVGRTPVSYAAEKGYEGSIQLLLQKGADIESEDGAGRTPLCYAARNGQELSLRLLLQRGANIESEDRDGRTPLSYAAENGQERSLRRLIEKGAEVGSKDSAGRTPLSYAAENGQELSLELLLQSGANIESEDRAGRTPLSYAVSNGHTAVVKLLRSRIET
ncbi:hypothetical protein V496_00173 [Pseudogymnoascus sp. VKM F-4515 (FW-2607)]|nr:hypothetical protein V496_00173 [Pseudogymnoascus sp. VKM F-4515 (FW-2607)]